ncbi:MAG TPA: hypothetical protein VFO93_10045 [Hymenobacter sp.]|uniref:hypothetical protein n=1 Tax=Hymenobacter sp. TaxID=1898978 RepID=UPI002D7ED817|nr:hypothetical protein [Hymenobacter sp.]HET9503874.1 hypothetical protein [Hymenobacter sp.]
MLVSVLPVPFADAGRQRQFEAVRAALEAEADAPATVLLGNLGAFSPVQADVLVVRPTGLALGVFVLQAGQLTIPTLTAGPWLLDGQPLPGRAGSDNPFAQYQQQLPVAVAWLGEHLGLPEDKLPPCAGFALFEAPLTFGPAVEAQLHRAAHDFQLLGEAAQLPARLRQQLAAGPALDADELLDWGEWLASEPYIAHHNGIAESRSLTEGLFGSPTDFLEQKLRQLWRWLGAEDIPADPPYGAPPPADQHLRDQQEQARLQQLRQELQAELHQQRQEAAAREAARTQELALLRQQLAQAGPSPTERAAEQRAKEAIEESLRTARAELATRNAELDARIQQLGQLIGRLHAGPGTLATTAAVSALPVSARPPGALAAPVPATAKKPRPATAPRWSFRRLRQAERWGLVVLGLAGVGAGTWGVVRWAQQPAPRPAATVAQRALPDAADEYSEENQPTTQDEQADSLARMQAAAIDTLTTHNPTPIQTSAEPEPATTETETKEAPPSDSPTPEATPAATESPAPTVPATTTEPAPASPTPATAEPSPTP